jgi:26S proteasome regulatory subunit N9
MEDTPEGIHEFLLELTEKRGEDTMPYFLQAEDLWERKLWKQLADLLEELYAREDSQGVRLPIYRRFISTFATHISQLKRVAFGIAAAAEIEDRQAALSFMTALAEEVNKPASRDAYVFATIEAARMKLALGDMEGAQKATTEVGAVIDAFDSVDPLIHAAFYRVSADYHKAKANYTPYYRQALLYLACVKLEALPLGEAQERAFDLSVAALLGTDIYNFGELLLHPVLQTLADTEHKWLIDYLAALNAGDLAQFEQLLPHVAKLPLLQQSLPFLRQKICLMSLIEAVFKRRTHDRVLTFATIAAETRLPVHEVEHLLMKALALKLIQGAIDQVDETVAITWVQPRVLDLRQIRDMKDRLLNWSSHVQKLESSMHSETRSFIQAA